MSGKPDPTMTRFRADFGYTSSDKYRMTVGFRSGVKDAPKPATPKEALVAAIDEMARIGALFGFADEVKTAVNDACERVAAWRESSL